MKTSAATASEIHISKFDIVKHAPIANAPDNTKEAEA